MTSRIWRRLTAAAAVLALAGAINACALEDDEPAKADDGSTVVKVGYLHTVAVDTHLWLGIEEGIFEEHGLKIEPVPFDTGIEESQALSGGSVDVAMMGGVLSNFPATGSGNVFLANDVEFDTAQLWTAPGSGIKSVADLEGKKVATTEGTTAHVYLYNAIKESGIDPDSVEILNTDMPAAVSAFVSGNVPAVALWVPFDETVKKDVDGAKMVDSAKEYYPKSAILGGWAASGEMYEGDKEVLGKLAEAWLDINDELVNNTDSALKTVHESAYADTQELADTKRQFSFAKLYPNDRWAKLWKGGEVEKWIGQAEQIFVDVGGIPEFVEPNEFVDSEIFLDAYDEWKADSK